MMRLSRNLLAIATLIWVAPLSAQQRPTETGYEHWASAGCPNEKKQAIVIRADGRLAQLHAPEAARSAFLP
jgi:hypothetical protein